MCDSQSYARWQARMAHCWRNVDEKLPFQSAERALTESLRRMTTESERSSTRDAASMARTPPGVSRPTWNAMSGSSGRGSTTILPSLLSHQRSTAPLPRGEESQDITAILASDVSPARKEA